MLIKFLYLIFAYLCGSIPFAYIVAKVVKKIDIRKIGSCNPGTTNVFRSIGKGTGILVFVFDTLKGFIPVFFAAFIDNSFSYSVAVSVVVIIGHMFTIFLNFKGGKGVATGFGVFLALMFLPCFVAFVVFGLVFLLSGYVALGSIVAAVTLPLAAYFTGYWLGPIIFSFAVAMLIIYKHKANIVRLKNGTENKFKILKRK
ncbi:MAG: glycerol-3-phosphate 1-O-acyltransferase PlsY [Endomicrobium sp.]|jgi:glycerol-3-phosphate acyltransferase PlsY|nr:glycerol-3-phosphate 1-O-acyltransferase PlsY [Endomicrobium sp.]